MRERELPREELFLRLVNAGVARRVCERVGALWRGRLRCGALWATLLTSATRLRLLPEKVRSDEFATRRQDRLVPRWSENARAWRQGRRLPHVSQCLAAVSAAGEAKFGPENRGGL